MVPATAASTAARRRGRHVEAAEVKSKSELLEDLRNGKRNLAMRVREANE